MLSGFSKKDVELLWAVSPEFCGFVFEATVEVSRVEAHEGFERRYAKVMRPQFGHTSSLPMKDKVEIRLRYFRHVTVSERMNLRQPRAAGEWKR